MNESNNDYVSLVRIPRKWFYVFVWTFSVLVIGHTLADVFFGWRLESLGETVFTRMAVLMTVIVGLFFIFSHIVEVIMLGHAKLFREQVYAEGKAEGKKETLNAFREAQQKGIPLEKVLETYDTANNNETSGTDTPKRDY